MPHEGRGGERTPENPAPVSGPGALSRRTDGGPGRLEYGNVDPGQTGEAQRLRAMQQASPAAISDTAPMQRGARGQAPQTPQEPQPQEGAFGPTERPNESPTAGARRIVPRDPVPLLRAIYRKHGNEDLRRLIEWADQRQGIR